MFLKGVDWCTRPLEQGIHMAATIPALRKLFAGKSLVAQIRDLQEALEICGTQSASKELRRKRTVLSHWRSDQAEAGPSRPFPCGFLWVPVQLQETQVVAFLGHNREDTTRG